MIKILTFLILAIIFTTPVTAGDLTKSEIRGAIYDEISSPNNTTLLWKVNKFTGFFYPVGEISETLRIDQTASNLTGSGEIHKAKLLYNTSWKSQKYLVFSEKGKKVENGLEYNDSFGTFTKNSRGGYYARIYWFGDLYVAVNGKANRLARLIKEQEKEEKQIVELGTTWEFGEGYSLKVEAVDTKVSPRQAWLSLSRDGKTLNEKIVNEGEVYTYVEKSLKDELDVPVFTTYVESIFSGNEEKAAFVQLRYTWLISQDILEIEEEDNYGIFEVKDAEKNYLLLYNNDKSISLDQNSIIDLANGTKFGSYNTTLIWDLKNFSDFWYNTSLEESNENLTINQPASNLTASSRDIQANNLIYVTSRVSKKYAVFGEKGKKVENGFEYNDTTRTFSGNITGGYYAGIGWFGDLYVALNGKANKLARLLIDQGASRKTLTNGETWDLGEDYSLTVNEIDAKVTPRQAHLVFSRNGNKLEDKIVTEGTVYTYVQKNLAGETDVPVFVTFVDSIFSGNTSAKIQVRYTWFISQNATEIKVGDEFGELKVKVANKDYLRLSNNDKINLEKDKDVDIGGGIKFRVEDNSNALRFYPFVEHTIKALSQEIVDAKSATPTITTIPANTNTSDITSIPAILQTSGPKPSLTSAITVALTDARTSEPSGTSASTTAVPQNWYLVLGATLGLITTGYLLSRKK